MNTSLRAVVAAGVAMALFAAAAFGWRSAVSVVAGAAIAAANLWALARIIAALLPSDADQARSQSRVAWALLAIVKIFGLLAVVWLLMRHGVVSPLPLVLGYMALPIGIAIGSLVSDRSAPEEP
jgi:hypothetical protein